MDRESGEECDLAAQNSDQGGCLLTCQHAACGDGLVHVGVEACDDGNTIDDDGCTNACTLPAPTPDVQRPELPDEGCYIDPATLRLDSDSGIEYYADLLRVTARPGLDAQEEQALLAIPDVVALRCGIRDPSERTFGVYTVRLSEARELSALEAVAAAIRQALPRAVVTPVMKALPVSDLRYYATDIEETDWDDLHEVASAYVFARAWSVRHPPQPVSSAIHDTGVCMLALHCSDPTARVLGPNLAGVFSPGGRFPGLAKLEGELGFPLDGRVDWKSHGHGTAVAAFLGDPSDGTLTTVEGERIGNGIVAGLYGGQHRSFSYVGPTIVKLEGPTVAKQDKLDTQSLELWNFASACARGVAASNQSYGLKLPSSGSWPWLDAVVSRNDKVPLFALFEGCKDTLWVYGAGNDGAEVSTSSRNADMKDYTGTAAPLWDPFGVLAANAPPNVVGVAALNSFGDLRQSSDRGSGVRLAAVGTSGTSFAAPMVTSAAALLAAVDPTPTAPTPTSGRGAALAALLQATGRRVEGTPSRSIAVASALLVNRALEPEAWLPFISEELVYGGQADLGDLRKDPRLKGGVHEESSTWTFDRTNHSIVLRDSGKERGAGTLIDYFPNPGYDCGVDVGASCDFSTWDYSFESSVVADEMWRPTVVAERDAFDPERIIPVLATRRLGSNRVIQGSMRIQGPKPIAHQETPGELGMSGLTYCLQITWEEDPEASSAVRIPLANLGSTDAAVRSHVLRNVEVRGRIRRLGGPAGSALPSVSCEEPLPAEIDEPSQEEVDAWAENVGAMPGEVGYAIWSDYEMPTDLRFHVRLDDFTCDTVDPGRERGGSYVLSDGELVDPHHVLAGSPVTSIKDRDGTSEIVPCVGRARGSIDLVATQRAVAMAAGFPRSAPWTTAQHLTVDEQAPWDLRSGVTPISFEWLLDDIDSLGGLFPGQWRLFEEWMFHGMLTPRPEPDPVALWSDGAGFLREKAFPLLSARLLSRAVP